MGPEAHRHFAQRGKQSAWSLLDRGLSTSTLLLLCFPSTTFQSCPANADTRLRLAHCHYGAIRLVSPATRVLEAAALGSAQLLRVQLVSF